MFRSNATYYEHGNSCPTVSVRPEEAGDGGVGGGGEYDLKRRRG